MFTSASRWALCLGTALVLPGAALAGTESSPYPTGPLRVQLAQAQGQMQMRPGQAPGSQQMASQDQMTQQEINNFLSQTAQVLRQAASSRSPQQVAQYLKQHMLDDAMVTAVSELYLGNTLIGQTFAQVPEEEISDILGLGAPVLHGRRLLQDYSVDMSIQNISLSPNQQRARVHIAITESGRLMPGELAGQAMARIRQHLAQMGFGQQGGGQMQGMQGQGMGMQGMQPGMMQGMQPGMQGGGFGQFAQGQMGGQMQGTGQGQTWRQFGIGAPDSLRFQGQTTCVMELAKESGSIKIGNTFCRAQNQLS